MITVTYSQRTFAVTTGLLLSLSEVNYVTHFLSFADTLRSGSEKPD